MRLSPEQIACIKNAAREVWGDAVRVRLFGSRADDSRRGGDIDLYIEGVQIPLPSQWESKIKFLVRLKQQIGDQRVDLVFEPLSGQAELPIQRMAQQTGVAL